MLDSELRPRLAALKGQLDRVNSFRHVQLALIEIVELMDQLHCRQEDPIQHYDTGSGATGGVGGGGNDDGPDIPQPPPPEPVTLSEGAPAL